MATAMTLAPVITTGTAGTAAVPIIAVSLAVRVTSFIFQNQSTGSVYIGASAVTTSAGLLVAAGASASFDHEQLRTEMQTYDPSNYFVISAQTGAAFVSLYNYIANRGS